MTDQRADLRRRVLQGGAYMAARQVLGMAISMGGLLLVARLIGAQAYGTYATAFGILMYASMLGQSGLDVFLIRKAEPPERADLDQAFTLLLGLGLTGAALAWPIALAARDWVGIDHLDRALMILLAGLPLNLTMLAPMAALQRAMNFRAVAGMELTGQIVLYGTAIPLALMGWGLDAPLAGWWMQQAVMALGFFILARYRPRLRFEPSRLRDMVGYGLGYAASTWIWQARLLINPLIIAKLLGAEAAANVAVAIRFVEGLSFMRNVVWRVSLPALGRLQDDHPRMARAVEQGMGLQVLAIGPAMLAFSVAAIWLVPMAFGREWTPILEIFPYLALAYLANGLFSLDSSALYVIRRTGDVALFHALHVVILFGATIWAVPRFGLMGYGLAEIAALSSYGLLHLLLTRAIGPVALGLSLTWTAGFGLALFAPLWGEWAWGGLALVAVLPGTWRAAIRYRAMALELRQSRKNSTQAPATPSNAP